ncbi:hypothetical protein [Methylocystis iwaonis]|uniref:Methyltransferase FkbM domain-containing protein n=1 Tax=Methylocystis iwaonis TaxID=2885079 RepID=A0ABM8ECX3_9HYPH|nr:hypothetical protein [Methylocystis iwaonis]BDV35754.1 hypothetical protein SS37A_32830 [Methylocystis iwaonis]
MLVDPQKRVSEIRRVDQTKLESTYISRSGFNEFSQYGEDGVIKKIFSILKEDSRWSVEFGAWDGKYLSNTHALMRQGWDGVFIEGNTERFKDLQATYSGNSKAHMICGMVDFDPEKNSLEYYLSKTAIPLKFDLLSIDIDGNDWHIWNSMTKYRPRVVVIEFNPTVPNDVFFTQERDFSINMGCSLLALVELGKDKGYELCAVTNSNAFFVVDEEFGKLGIKDNSIPAMYHDFQSARIFTGPASEIVTVELILFWYGVTKVPPDLLQVLPKDQIRYGDALGLARKPD